MTSALNHNDYVAIQWGVVLVASLVAAVIDFRTRLIPNWLTFTLFFAGLAYSMWIGGVWGLAEAQAAGILLALPFLLLFVFARGGAGDAKLMGAIGVWLGIASGTIVLVAVAGAGIAVALTASLWRRSAGTVLRSACHIATSVALTVVTGNNPRALIEEHASVQHSRTIPYGVAIFIGVAAAALGVALWKA